MNDTRWLSGAIVPRCSDDLRASGNELMAGCQTNSAAAAEHNRFLACKTRHLRTRLTSQADSQAAAPYPGDMRTASPRARDDRARARP